MNKREKEVMQYQLDSEKAVIKQLETQYKKALNDINTKIRILESDELTQSRIYRIEHQKALKGQVEGILEKLHSDEYSTISQFLSASYTDSFIGTVYDLHGQGVPLIMPIDPQEAVAAVMTNTKLSESLYDSLGVDTKKLSKTISSEITRGIASDMSFNEIARNISNATKAPLSRAKTIVATESHRISEEANYNAQNTAISKGADVVKQWNSTLDGATRTTHRQLDGQIREVDKPFEANGRKAMYPGGFGDSAEDCNCRCRSLTRARWALDEDELQTLKERAEFFGLDNTENFEEFRIKYLGIDQKTLEKSAKSGKINMESSIVKDAISSGIVSTVINADKQNRHIKDGDGYIEGRSYTYGTVEDAQQLVDELSGTGTPIVANGEWQNKERVTSNSVVGVHIDPETKAETETKNATIIYSKTGSHVIPRKEDDE